MLRDPQVIIQFLTALTAFSAVIIGPLLTRRQIRSSEEIARRQIRASIAATKRQIRASTVSTNRQVWINTLRDALADFLSKEAMARTYNRLHHADAESLGRIEEVYRLNFKISLLINSQEPDHARLVESLEKMTNTIDDSNKEPGELKQIDDCINGLRIETVALSQRILKSEWERVKTGE